MIAFSVFVSRVAELASSRQFLPPSLQYCIEGCHELDNEACKGITGDTFLCSYAAGDGTAAFAVTDANTPSSAVGITAPTVLHFTVK